MSAAKQDTSLTIFAENSSYLELTRSIPEREMKDILKELDSSNIVKRAEKLKEELAKLQTVGLDVNESRTLFLAALRCVKLQQISIAQLATLHILDSAIRTLYTEPVIYCIHKYVGAANQVVRTYNLFTLATLKAMPTSVKRFSYELTILPKDGVQVSDLPWRMQKPLIQRFFNLTESEWKVFCNEMKSAPLSEQHYNVLNTPEEGCWSSITFQIQKVLKCMRVLDWMVDSNEGLLTEKIMVIPSFTMFQAALTAKGDTLKRNPVQLIPTYGYIEAKRYAELKASGKIALALHLPLSERMTQLSSEANGRTFRTTVDGHPSETAFSGAIHDVYHAMREMSMSENVAKARMRLASIAKTHPKNKINPNSRTVDDILVDGELIFSYPPDIDTMFEPEYRPPQAEVFGRIFYTDILKTVLHEDLKRAFIEDMVKNKSLWQEQFGLSRADLLTVDLPIYDEIQASFSANSGNFSPAHAISKIGFLSTWPIYQELKKVMEPIFHLQ